MKHSHCLSQWFGVSVLLLQQMMLERQSRAYLDSCYIIKYFSDMVNYILNHSVRQCSAGALSCQQKVSVGLYREGSILSDFLHYVDSYLVHLLGLVQIRALRPSTTPYCRQSPQTAISLMIFVWGGFAVRAKYKLNLISG